ncbi:MAG: hypothetical protein RR973_05500, partial [Anaerovoracaceae bacterium]
LGLLPSDFWQYVGKSRLRSFTFLFYILWDLLSVFVFLLSKRQHFFHFMTTFFFGRTNPSDFPPVGMALAKFNHINLQILPIFLRLAWLLRPTSSPAKVGMAFAANVFARKGWHGFCGQRLRPQRLARPLRTQRHLSPTPTSALGMAFARSRQPNRQPCHCLGTALAPANLKPQHLAQLLRRPTPTSALGMAFANPTLNPTNGQNLTWHSSCSGQPKTATYWLAHCQKITIGQVLKIVTCPT